MIMGLQVRGKELRCIRWPRGDFVGLRLNGWHVHRGELRSSSADEGVLLSARAKTIARGLDARLWEGDGKRRGGREWYVTACGCANGS